MAGAGAIVKDDDVLLARGFGLRDVDNKLEVTARTLFPIASCTKAFTTAAMSMLADEGKLDWDAPVRTYLPTFKLYDAFTSEYSLMGESLVVALKGESTLFVTVPGQPRLRTGPLQRQRVPRAQPLRLQHRIQTRRLKRRDRGDTHAAVWCVYGEEKVVLCQSSLRAFSIE